MKDEKHGEKNLGKDEAEIRRICEQIRNSDPSILSLTIAGANGTIIAHSYGKEYEQEYLERASKVRERAGAWAALMLGIEYETDDVFGETECIVRVHKKGKLMVVPFNSKKMVLAMLTTRDASEINLLPKIQPLLASLEY